MRVAVDYQIFQSQKYGGISRYHVELGKALKKIDCNVDFISPFFINHYLRNLKEVTVYGKYKNSMPNKSSRYLKYLNNILFIKYLIRYKPDIIHNTLYRIPFLQNKNTPSVLTVHDMIHELYPENFSQKDNTAELKRRAINYADHIICISQNTYNDLLNIYDISESNVSVIHHGFNNITRSGVTEVNEEKPYLLYVGSRKGHKNFNALLKAYSLTEELKKNFDIICFGGGNFREHEIKKFYRLGLYDKIHFKSGNDVSLSSYYKNAQAFIYPSLYEGFGMPPLEAMANNCPVIASNSSSIPEVVGEAGEYFDPNDLESILNAIDKVIYDEKNKSKLIELGNRRLDEFSWEKCASKTRKIYQELS